MKRYKIYNFDHGFTAPRDIAVGPFKIIITASHCSNLNIIPRKERYQLGFIDDTFKRELRKIPKVKGKWAETAIVEIAEKMVIPSIITPEFKRTNNVDDLCLLLTVLTGRRVCRRHGLTLYNPQRQYQAATNIHNIIFWGTSCWSSFNNITSKNLTVAFYNLTMAVESNDMFAMAAYATAVLNVCYEQWWRESGQSYIDKTTGDIIRDGLKSIVESEIKRNNIPPRIAQDISNGISNIAQPSALYKLHAFLMHCDIYPKTDTDTIFKRLRWLNWMRNSFLHTGDVKRRKEITAKQHEEVNLAIVCITLDICIHYFLANVLGIKEEYGLNRLKENLQMYFLEGKYNKQDVFTESYAEFIKRIETSWVEEGIR